jgi:hopanoid-associated phosphorylase
MLLTTPLPVIAVTGMAFEARIAAGPGVRTVCSSSPDTLTADLAAAIAMGCRGIVSFGIAGGLAAHVKPGTCIIARSVVTAKERFDSHLEWASHLLQTIPGAIHADIVGSRDLVTTSADKIALGRSTGAVAVDMESRLCVDAAIAHDLPFAAVRVVADPHDRALPHAAQIGLLPDGTSDLPAVMRSVMGRPRQVAALIRVALDTRTARAALVRARRQLGPGFGLVDLVKPVVAPQPAIAPAD